MESRLRLEEHENEGSFCSLGAPPSPAGSGFEATSNEDSALALSVVPEASKSGLVILSSFCKKPRSLCPARKSRAAAPPK